MNYKQKRTKELKKQLKQDEKEFHKETKKLSHALMMICYEPGKRKGPKHSK